MTLTIQDLGALGELLGSVAVLVTLVYLAFQTRQNTMAIGAQLDAARLESAINLNLAAATSSELSEALGEDRADDRTINEERRRIYWYTMLLHYPWQFRQARRGLLPSFNEPGMGLRVGSLFNAYRSLGGWWERGKPNYVSEFVEWVEEQRSKAA